MTTRKTDSTVSLAEDVREACIEAAISGYQNAAISGLCAEGAFEAAISAIRMLDVNEFAVEKNKKKD